MVELTLNLDGLKPFVDFDKYQLIEKDVLLAHDMLEHKTGAGSNMLGWIDLPVRITDEEKNKIKETATEIRKKADVFLIIGIGGSYIGSKAVIDMFSNSFSNLLEQSERKFPQIIYIGNNLSAKYIKDVLGYIEDKEVCVNVISKSGETLEIAIAFRMIKLFMEKKYGIGLAAERIFVTTDKDTGTLRNIAVKEGYKTFEIDKDIGGRYSVLSPVGLLPIAVAGIDFEDLLDGAMLARQACGVRSLKENACYMYAASRKILYENGKDIEILGSYEPRFSSFIKWYKQLFAESEGKNLKGIFPAGANYTTDLHSIGQLVQDGKRNIFETIINIERSKEFLKVPKIENSVDGIDYIEDMEIDYINSQIANSAYDAHIKGKVPNIAINLKEFNEYNIGQLIYFFEKACAISGYLFGVNPFNQEGVEEYKKNVKRLLNKEV